MSLRRLWRDEFRPTTAGRDRALRGRAGVIRPVRIARIGRLSLAERFAPAPARLLTAVVSSALLGCAAVRTAPPAQAFNAAAFAGLVDASGEDGRLDYVLEGANGAALRFASCTEVDATAAAAVREDQHTVFRQLRTNCQALARHASGRPARDSHLPEALMPTLVGNLPSTALPDVGGQAMVSKAGERLKAVSGVADIEALPGGRVRVLTRGDDIVYTLMAQGDFDGDGVQDMLLRLDWRARDAFGRRVELLQITRYTAGGPVELTWRLPAAP